MFHFNKKHLEDPTIPMWVIKTKGESYYVNHVDCTVPWSTKETPDNSHTKGSIKVKNCLLVIDDENCASIDKLTSADMLRIKRKDSVRVITSYGKMLKDALANIKHGRIKLLYGSCGSEFWVTDLFNKDDLPMLHLAWQGRPGGVRVLMPNEPYYQLYDTRDSDSIDIDSWEDLYEE